MRQPPRVVFIVRHAPPADGTLPYKKLRVMSVCQRHCPRKRKPSPHWNSQKWLHLSGALNAPAFALPE